MTTFNKFTRSLNSITVFDDDDAVSGMEVVSTNSQEDYTSASNLFITALLDHICSLYTGKQKKGIRMHDKLFHVLCETLVKARIMSPSWNAAEFASIRHRYQEQIVLLFEAAVQSVNQDVLVTSSRLKPQSVQAFLPSRTPMRNFSLEYGIPSKLTGEFRDIEKIGKGAYGKVFKAKKKSDGRTYAVKQIVFEHVDSFNVQKTFSEVKLLAQLSHPNIVRYYDNWVETREVNISEDYDSESSSESSSSPSRRSYGFRVDDVLETSCGSSIVFQDGDEKKQPGPSLALVPHSAAAQHHASRPQTLHSSHILRSALLLYIQMELCQKTLKDWIETRNYCHQVMINDEENRKLYKQILKGVNFIHSQRLIHRDLKPQNIFLQTDLTGSSSYTVKIGDFGLATLIGAKRCVQFADTDNLYTDVTHGETCTDELTAGIGTTLYSSPEQLNETHYTSKSDMFSLGVILYELYQPFSTENERRVCIERLRTGGTLEENVKKNWPLQAHRVEELTCFNPNKRPSAKELLEGRLFYTKEQIITDLSKQITELQKQLHAKDLRIAELERLLDQRPST